MPEVIEEDSDVANSIDDPQIGKRLRELRVWRDVTVRELAGLAGCSASYVSMVENGHRACDSRAMVHAFADALRVEPSELLDVPLPERDPVSREAHEGVENIGTALASNRLGHPFREEPVAWPELAGDLQHFIEQVRPTFDYVQYARLLPDLIERLYTAHATAPAHRREALVGLMRLMGPTVTLLKTLGSHGLPHLAAVQMRYVAEELDDPAWVGAAEWRAGQASADDRNRMLAISMRAAKDLESNTDPRCQQVRGMLHLNAAMASAVIRRSDDARAHLNEAWQMAQATRETPMFAGVDCSAPNWTVWRASIGVELGEGPRVAELEKDLDQSLLLANRRATFHGDVARGLAQDRRTRDKALVMMLTAERIAPHVIRPNPLMRETVGDLMRRRRRDAAGRELRGLAYRMGLAV